MFNQFQKISLLSSIADQLAYICVQNGNPEFMDYVDLNCGAVPEGDFSHVIDPSAPQQFLAMYTQIAEDRFAFSVTGLIKLNPAFRKALQDSMFNAGKDLHPEKALSPEDAFRIIQLYVLDGMPEKESKKLISSDENQLVWEKTIENHQQSWQKAGGDLQVYYQLLESFVNGLLAESEFTLKIENMQKFIISKKEC